MSGMGKSKRMSIYSEEGSLVKEGYRERRWFWVTLVGCLFIGEGSKMRNCYIFEDKNTRFYLKYWKNLQYSKLVPSKNKKMSFTQLQSLTPDFQINFQMKVQFGKGILYFNYRVCKKVLVNFSSLLISTSLFMLFSSINFPKLKTCSFLISPRLFLPYIGGHFGGSLKRHRNCETN